MFGYINFITLPKLVTLFSNTVKMTKTSIFTHS